MGSHGDARHRQPFHGIERCVHPRGRERTAARLIRRTVQCLRPRGAQFFRHLSRVDAGRLRFHLGLSSRHGARSLPREIAIKGQAVSEMLFMLETARAMFYRSISESQTYPPAAVVQRARVAHVTIQRNVVALTQEAIRVCGGRAMLKQFPLERFARDARAAAVMRPWTQDIATQQAWESALEIGDGARYHQQPGESPAPGVSV